MIADYHMHLRGTDGRLDFTVEGVERFVDLATSRGIDEIGFSEHVYYFEQTRELWDEPWMLQRSGHDIEPYVEAVLEAKGRGLPVKLGLEVDYAASRERDTAETLSQYPWDYLLGSVHFVDGFPVDQEPGLVEKLGPNEAWRRYFVWLRNAARSGLFDSLSHPDLAKHHGPRPDAETVQFLHEETADAIEAAGVCVEVSAAGLHKPVGELYPDAPLLEACHARGVPITLASDAHEPEHVGRDVHRAVELARSVGYETVTIFDARERRQEPLG